MQINIGLVDRNRLILRGLSLWINTNENFVVTIEATSRNSLIKQLNQQPESRPQIILLSFSGSVIDAFQIISIIKEQYPLIKMIATVPEPLDNRLIVKALQAGVNGFLLTDSLPDELFTSFQSVLTKEFYCPDPIVTILKNWTINPPPSEDLEQHLYGPKRQFIKLVCTDLTYEEIAAKMKISIKTIENYRTFFFEK